MRNFPFCNQVSHKREPVRLIAAPVLFMPAKRRKGIKRGLVIAKTEQTEKVVNI